MGGPWGLTILKWPQVAIGGTTGCVMFQPRRLLLDDSQSILSNSASLFRHFFPEDQCYLFKYWSAGTMHAHACR